MAETTADTFEYTLKVDGTDRTSKVAKPGNGLGLPALQWTNALTRAVDRLEFGLVDSGALGLRDWLEVILHVAGDPNDKLFGGYIISLEGATPPGNPDRADYRVSCADYSVLLDKAVVNKEWFETADDTIISEIFSYAEPDLSGVFDTSTEVAQVLSSVEKFRAARLTVRQALDRLANMIGADWYIDADKQLHYFDSNDADAPYDLTDDSPDGSTTHRYADLGQNISGSERVNRVTIVGGLYLSESQTFFLPGTGEDTRIQLPFKSHGPVDGSPIQVWRNSGSEESPQFDPLTVSAGYVTTLSGTAGVLHYFQEKALEGSPAWPNFNNAAKVTARIEVPLRKRVRDQDSRDFYGRWFEKVINDTSITTKAEATRRGEIELAKYAMKDPAYSCRVWHNGLRAGQAIELTSGAFGLSAEELLIQKVVLRDLGNNRVTYDLQLGLYNPDLIDMIYSLRRETANKPQWRDDEVLDELLGVEETLELVESSTQVTETSEPYNWAQAPADAGEFNWGFGKWQAWFGTYISGSEMKYINGERVRGVT